MSDAAMPVGPPEIADQLARDLVAEFELPFVRVWLLQPPDRERGVLVLGATATHEPAVEFGGMTEESVARVLLAAEPATEMITTPKDNVRFAAPLPEGSFLGLPVVDGDQRFAFIEIYTAGTLGLAFAAQLDKRVNEIVGPLLLAQVTSELNHPGSAGSQHGRILIADDDAGIRAVVRRLLTARGFEVCDVANGLLAYERAQQESFDLILLDWMMPIMDGPTAAAKLKANARTHGVPVVMLTSQARIDDKVTALESGAQDFITKPFSSRELVARVEQQLRWRKLLAGAHAADTENEKETVDLGDFVPATGDLWTQAMEASQLGKPREALALFMQEAEQCDRDKHYARAAIAYRGASAEAGRLRKLDLSNRVMRLAGKMYLCWADAAVDSTTAQEAYMNAARSFMAAGNLKLTKKSVDLASSLASVLADDEPPALTPLTKRRP